MNKIQKAVHHIETVQSGLYTKTFNKELMAGKKALLRIGLKGIKDLQSEIKTIRKENKQLRAEIKAYERITQ